MDKRKLLFNKGNEEYYNMVETNEIFSSYCEEVFGIDFSQDGFGDLVQVDELIKVADINPRHTVLDIGCGNGKMAEYIAEKTGAFVYGFDYSENAIRNARQRTKEKDNLEFEEGLIGEKEYEPEKFDVVISIDTMYFTLDMEEFVKQIYSWLKPNGKFVAYYGEGQMKSMSEDEDSSELAIAFKNLDISYVTLDYTKKHYELMKHKREVIEKWKEQFLGHDMEFYYQCAVATSIDPKMSFEEFQKKFNRYMYIARKEVGVNANENPGEQQKVIEQDKTEKDIIEQKIIEQDGIDQLHTVLTDCIDKNMTYKNYDIDQVEESTNDISVIGVEEQVDNSKAIDIEEQADNSKALDVEEQADNSKAIDVEENTETLIDSKEDKVNEVTIVKKNPRKKLLSFRKW